MQRLGPSFQNFFKKEYKDVERVYYLSIVLMLFYLGWAVVDSFMAIEINDIIQDAFLLGIFFSLWGIIRFFTDSIFGSFFDFVDNKKLLLISLVGYSIVGLGYYFATTTAMVFAVRIVHVFFGSVFWVGVWSYTHHVVEKRKREQSIIFELILSNIPYIFAPFIGAFLFTTLEHKFLYLAIPITSMIAFTIFLLKGKPTKGRKHVTLTRILNNDLKVIKGEKKKLFTISYVMIPFFMVMSAFAVFLPVHLIQSGYSAFVVASFTVISIIPIFVVMPLGKFSDKYGRIPLFTIGVLLITGGLLFFSYASNTFQILLCALIIGSGSSILSPTANALVGDLAKKSQRGTMAGITETTKDLGQIIGPLLAGLIIAKTNFETLVLVLSIIPVLMLFIALLYKKINLKPSAA